MLLPLSIYAVYAVSFTMSKEIFSYLPPLLYIGLRILCAGVILLSYTILRYGIHYVIYGIYNNWRPFFRLTAVHTYIPFTLSFIALKEVATIEASLIYNISPCVTAVFSYMWFNQHMNWIKIAGLAVSMGALIPFFYSRIVVHAGTSVTSIDSLLLLIISVSFTTYGWLLYSMLNNDYGYNSTLISSFSLLGGGSAILATSYLFESWNIDIGDAFSRIATLFIALMLAVDIIFMNIYGQLLSQYSATFMALIGITLPLFTSIFGWTFLGEAMPKGFILSCCMVTIGLYLFYYGERHDTKTPCNA